jgi:putative ABC transport system permease protein
MMTVILAGLNERRREMALLRAIGARPREIFGLLVAEAGLLAGTGVLLGAALGMGALAVARPMITARFGVDIALHAPASAELRMLAAIVIAGLATGLVRAARAYFTSLGDGLQPRT